MILITLFHVEHSIHGNPIFFKKIFCRYCEVESYDLGKENVRIAAGAGATKLRKEGII